MKGGERGLTVRAGDAARWTSGGGGWVQVRRLLAGREVDEEPGLGEGVGLRALDERLRRVKRSETCVLSGPSKDKMVGR